MDTKLVIPFQTKSGIVGYDLNEDNKHVYYSETYVKGNPDQFVWTPALF